MQFVVTVTETLQTEYTIEAPSLDKAMETFENWVEDGGSSIVAHDLSKDSPGWEYDYFECRSSNGSPDIIYGEHEGVETP